MWASAARCAHRSDRPGAVEARRLTDLQNPGTSSYRAVEKTTRAVRPARRRRVNEARGRIAVGGAVGSFACSGPTLLCRYYSSRKRVGHIDRSNPRAPAPVSDRGVQRAWAEAVSGDATECCSMPPLAVAIM